MSPVALSPSLRCVGRFCEAFTGPVNSCTSPVFLRWRFGSDRRDGFCPCKAPTAFSISFSFSDLALHIVQARTSYPPVASGSYRNFATSNPKFVSIKLNIPTSSTSWFALQITPRFAILLFFKSRFSPFLSRFKSFYTISGITRMSDKFLFALPFLVALCNLSYHIASFFPRSVSTPLSRRGSRFPPLACVLSQAERFGFTPHFAFSISRFELHLLRAVRLKSLRVSRL